MPTRVCRKKETKVPEKEALLEDSVLGTVSRKFYGATYLLDSIGEKLGIVDDLKFSFPEMHEQILSLNLFPHHGREESIVPLRKVGDDP